MKEQMRLVFNKTMRQTNKKINDKTGKIQESAQNFKTGLARESLKQLHIT